MSISYSFCLFQRDLGISDSYFEQEDADRVNNFEKDMYAQKSLYYKQKFDMEVVTQEKIHELAKCYIIGLQWVLSYYYTGVPSWSW